MCSADVKVIEEWFISMKKPIVDTRKSQAKLLPILRIVDKPDDALILKKLTKPVSKISTTE